MKTITKILGIGLIALIAMIGISAVSAFEIYDDTNDQPSVYSDDAGVNYRDEINQSCGGITVDDWVVPQHEPNYDIHVYSSNDGRALEIPGNRVNLVGSTFTGNYADNDGGAIYFTNGMTGSLSDGNGNLLTVDQSGFVVPGSSLNPPRPGINVPYYPTEVTEIVINDFSAEMTGDL